VAKRYPVKTLQRELLTFVVKQLSFFIFPATRVHHKKQNHLIKRPKKFQDGKWEDLWKQSRYVCKHQGILISMSHLLTGNSILTNKSQSFSIVWAEVKTLDANC
jgi:hypothetical protein